MVNKYAHLAPQERRAYDSQDKTYRTLPVMGQPGGVLRAGLIALYHGRRYELLKDAQLDADGSGLGRFKLQGYVDKKERKKHRS